MTSLWPEKNVTDEEASTSNHDLDYRLLGASSSSEKKDQISCDFAQNKVEDMKWKVISTFCSYKFQLAHDHFPRERKKRVQLQIPGDLSFF